MEPARANIRRFIAQHDGEVRLTVAHSLWNAR
jgi:hypothetical protein